ncbi:MAG TPA: hypothetical protein K8V56_05225 [Sporosarcina psychrophila]|uniref:Uncharacterized protein n=1 Tax=Sporosarcina psychrophila TaxID=1476 RepID=A0A921KC76_SPOPS|nr:hypothetical protein [Sporosarcina psychrophila]
MAYDPIPPALKSRGETTPFTGYPQREILLFLNKKVMPAKSGMTFLNFFLL